MANEASYQGTLAFSKSGAGAQLGASAVLSIAGSDYIRKTLTIGTSDETVPLDDIATAAGALLLIRNLDPTNYVELGDDGTDYDIKIPKSGFAGPMLWNKAAVHLKANSAPCLVEVMIVEA